MNTWLIAPLILGGILLLVFLIVSFGSVRIRVKYKDGALMIRASVFGITRSSYSYDSTETFLKDVSRCSNPDRLLQKEEKRMRKAAKKAARDLKKTKAVKPRSKPKLNLKELLDLVLVMIKHTYRQTKGKVHIKFLKFRLRVATGDAATTALLYGTVTQSAAYLLQWVQDHFNNIHRNEDAVAVEADFLSETPAAEIDILMHVRIYNAIGIVLALDRSYNVEKRRILRRRKKKSSTAK